MSWTPRKCLVYNASQKKRNAPERKNPLCKERFVLQYFVSTGFTEKRWIFALAPSRHRNRQRNYITLHDPGYAAFPTILPWLMYIGAEQDYGVYDSYFIDTCTWQNDTMCNAESYSGNPVNFQWHSVKKILTCDVSSQMEFQGRGKGQSIPPVSFLPSSGLFSHTTASNFKYI